MQAWYPELICFRVLINVDLARDLSSPATKVSRSPKARFDR